MSDETYSVSTHFPNGIRVGQLKTEIQNNLNISVKVDHIDVNGNVVTITFLSAISAPEKSVLDTIVLTHVPKPDGTTLVKVLEENTETGGNFQASTIRIDATKNTITDKSIFWPYNISALAMDFVTSSAHKFDIINLTIGENTIIGAITANVTPASAWVSQNYIVGNTVTYNTGDPDYGTRVYTCIYNTDTNQDPTNTIYWRHGFEISVSQTVTDNVNIGYCLKLYDGVNTNDVCEVLYIDKTNNKIYAQKNPTNSFSAASPTYVLQTVYMLKDHELGEAWEQSVGQSKIGASHIPKDKKITIHYDNKSTETDKVLIGRVEYLY